MDTKSQIKVDTRRNFITVRTNTTTGHLIVISLRYVTLNVQFAVYRAQLCQSTLRSVESQ